ncbi:hypothetical protein Tco_0259169, partial [Tanacetum coccineum]
ILNGCGSSCRLLDFLTSFAADIELLPSRIALPLFLSCALAATSTSPS